MGTAEPVGFLTTRNRPTMNGTPRKAESLQGMCRSVAPWAGGVRSIVVPCAPRGHGPALAVASREPRPPRPRTSPPAGPSAGGGCTAGPAGAAPAPSV